MSIHLQREIDRLKKSLLSLCALVEDQLESAMDALQQRDEAKARRVLERDAEVDQREVEVEEECLKALALHQPVACDLRFLVSVLKMDKDLERIGDMAVNIARKAITVAECGDVEIPFDLPGMWHKSRAMLRDSIDALVNRDAPLAQRICARDREVNRMKKESRRQAEERLRSQPNLVTVWLALLAVARNLERIADHAVNIAEDVIYLVEGRIVRHESSRGPAPNGQPD
jgi:phosphate transport system protein